MRLIPWLMLFIAAIMAISSVSFYYYVKNDLNQGMELRLSDSADKILLEISQAPEEYLTKPQSFLFSATSSEFTASGTLVQFMDNKGRLLAKSPGLKRNLLPFFFGEDRILRDIELSDGTEIKVFQSKIELMDKPIGYIIVGAPSSQITRTLDILRGVLIVFILGIMVVLAFGINALASLSVAANQKRFLSFVSHELRTPLSVIAGNAEVAMRKELSHEEYREALSEIKEESDWMNRLVSNLLMIFRGEAGVEKMSRSRFNLGELIAESASSIKKIYPDRNISLNLAHEAEITADPDRIKQVVTNLIENAAKYTNSGGKISVSLSSDPSSFIFEVSDNGVGIKKELQHRIFDAYYRVEQLKNSGMGLGLAISKWIVSAHRGRIRVKSEPGKGSVFTVTLPRK